MKKETKHTILYVDDEEANRRVFSSLFGRHYQVLTADSGKQGLEMLDKTDIDLIISDQRMPEMDGVSFLKEVLAKHPGPNRILLTAFSDFDAIRDAINQARIFQYIEKPLQLDSLKPVIDHAIEAYHLKTSNARLTRELQEKNTSLENLNRQLKKEMVQKQRINKELRKAKDKAVESDKLKSAFLSSMSHEIRTPLNAIVGFSNVLAEKTSDPKFQFFANQIVTQNKLLTKIVDDLLDLAKVESGTYSVKKTSIDLKKFINEIYHLYEKQCPPEVVLIPQVPHQDVKVLTDAQRLNQVYTNLISNALKFTQKGQIQFGYTIQNEQQITCFVSDTGIGIEEKMHSKIFDRFIKLDEFSQGTGLGLSIVTKIVELLGAKIRLDSSPGNGSRFYFDLPYNKQSQSATKDSSGESQKDLVELLIDSGQEIKLLIAEDNMSNFLYIRELLNFPCFHILHASNGQKAIEMCSSNADIDLVLMDLKMPIMDGFEATRKIKEKRPGLLVIIQTAFAYEKELEDKYAGWDGVLTKPINKQELFEQISKVLT